jgi:hypothetical protein
MPGKGYPGPDRCIVFKGISLGQKKKKMHIEEVKSVYSEQWGRK